jgi:serine/threonine protein kinase
MLHYVISGLEDRVQIGRYEVKRRLGRGAMGVVYLAADPKLGRDVAIKVLEPIIGEEDDFVSRFVREATTAGGLRKHPNIITVYDAGEYQNGDRTQYFIVMEYIEGEDLKNIIDLKVSVPFRQKVEMMIQTFKALHSAHSRGLVHRDVKPGNIRITSEGDVCIMDFGLAKFRSTELTGSLGVLGTPKYMSPEQTISSSNIDAQSDIFSAGLVLYEFLSGSLPFHVPDADVLGYMSAIRSVAHTPFSEAMPGVDPALAGIVDRALAKDKSARYQTCEEVANDLTAFLSRLDSLERGLSAELSRRGVLSKSIAGDSVPIASKVESVQFRPVEAATDYGLNLHRFKALKESTPPDRPPISGETGMGKVVVNRRKRILTAGALLLVILALVLGYRFSRAVDSGPGTLELDVYPWAEAVSITQVPGGKQFLQKREVTPFSINLPGGTYAVRVTHPQLGAFEFTVKITPAKSNRVLKTFPGFSGGEKPPQ